VHSLRQLFVEDTSFFSAAGSTKQIRARAQQSSLRRVALDICLGIHQRAASRFLVRFDRFDLLAGGNQLQHFGIDIRLPVDAEVLQDRIQLRQQRFLTEAKVVSGMALATGISRESCRFMPVASAILLTGWIWIIGAMPRSTKRTL
jgi:hypothetical protein